MLREKIKQEIQNKFIDSDIKIFTTDDKYFNTIIVSDIFKNKTLIERQKMVYEVINHYIISREIHAISLKTYTKDEWLDVN